MRIKHQILIVLFSIFFIFHGNIFPQSITFESVQPEDAPPLPTINCIVQDQFGFLWIGTVNGLYRFDGYTFKVFSHNPADSGSISGDHIWSVCEDKQGNLWIGTSGRGLNKYIRSEDSFIRYLPDPQDSTSLKSDFEIPWVTRNSDGDILIALWEDGLDKYNFDTDNFQNTKFIILDEEGTPRSSVHRIYEDSFGDLWVGTKRGLFRIKSENDSPILYQHKDSDPKSLGGNYIYALLEDRNNNLWIGTNDGGVSKFLRNEDSFLNYKHIPGNLSSLNSNNVIAMCVDSSGFIWIGTDDNGLNKLDPESGEIINFKTQTGNFQIPENITSLYTDASGVVWIGTVSSGLFKYSPKKIKFDLLKIHSDNSNSVIVDAVVESMNGTIWVGTEGEGLVHYSKNLAELKKYSYNGTKLPAIKYITSLTEDYSGNIWIGTPSEGVFIFNPDRQKFQRPEIEKKDLQNLEINCLMIDHSNVLWIGTDGESVITYDTENKIVTNQGTDPDSPFFDLRHVFVIYEDLHNNIWIGDWGEGIIKYDPVNKSSTRYPANRKDSLAIIKNKIISIEEDKFGNMWFGSWGEGLNKLDSQTNKFTLYTTANGLPNNNVYKVLSDEEGNIWISTSYGVSKLDSQKHEWINYDKQDGLQSMEFRLGSGYKGHSGKFYFGGVNGFNVFNPSEIRQNSFIPNLIFTSIKLSGEKISKEIIGSSVELINQINLSYDQNNISFEFASMEFTNPKKNQYEYKMEGFDTDWIYIGNKRLANYTNLDPGEYVFQVRGSNNDGIWNEEGRSIKVTITPPPWRTWWAYTLYILALISILYAVRRYELNRIRLKNQLELEHVESEKLKELDHLKSKFFANISHEFRTPLTLILGPLENVILKINSFDIKQQLGTAYNNGKRLLILINQLLDLSKLEAGSMKLTASNNNLIPFLKGVVYSLESLARQKKIELEFQSDYKNLPVYFDREKMEQLFYNLFSNAMKFTPEGLNNKILIKVTKEKISDLKVQSEGGECVVISIKDSGIGIPADQLANIFNRFYRVNLPFIDEQAGTGIGLSLVKEIVELHYGKITVSSKEGKGSEFTVILPSGKDHLKKNEIVEEKISAIKSDKPMQQFKDEKISNLLPPVQIDENINKDLVLIVEDNDDVRKFIKQQLDSDFKVLEATDGEDGIQKAVLSVPDLIISDILMPKINGNELCLKLKNDERTSHIPVILLTAKGGEES